MENPNWKEPHLEQIERIIDMHVGNKVLAANGKINMLTEENKRLQKENLSLIFTIKNKNNVIRELREKLDAKKD